MREDLLGYLLGALSPDEQRRVEDALAVDPELQRELERLRRSLEPLEAINDDQDPPAGLADRTLEAIEQHDEACRPTPLSVTRQRDASRATVRNGSSAPQHLYSISDGIVLALVGLTAITLLMPALANSRYEARKNVCQDNMRQIGMSLVRDSLRFGNRFIAVPLSGNRAFDGVYASTMLDRQLISANSPTLLCPGDERPRTQTPWYVPSLKEIDQADSTGAELDRLRRMAGGSYAYVVGYVDKRGGYHQIRNEGRGNFPILSDVPSLYLENRQSANHGGRGQNVFFEDGHITFVTHCNQLVGDDPWRNRQGYAEAGGDLNDAVLLPSEWPPIVVKSVDDALTPSESKAETAAANR